MSRRAHHPHTSRRYRPVREAVQRLPPAGTMHHLQAWTDHQSRQTPRPARREQSTVGQRRNPKHLPELAAVRGTDHRLAHPPQSQTRPIPRNHPQPAMAHHQNSSHQPTTPHQPRTRPRTSRLGPQPRLEPQNPSAAPKEPRHRHQPTQNTHPTSPNQPHHTQHHQLAEPDNQQAPRPPAMADPHRVGRRRLRLPRDLPQPATTPHRNRDTNPDRIRENPPR